MYINVIYIYIYIYILYIYISYIYIFIFFFFYLFIYIYIRIYIYIFIYLFIYLLERRYGLILAEDIILEPCGVQQRRLRSTPPALQGSVTAASAGVD